MSGLKWEFSFKDFEHVAKVGCIECRVNKHHDTWWFCNVTQAEELSSEVAAKASSEVALRAMFEDLREHFEPVPVLRWQTNADDGRSEASVGPWRLVASEHDWTVRHLEGPIVADAGCSRPSSDEHARRAAEDALRSLGVAFRTEVPR